MNLNNTTRFTIEKDAFSFLKNNNISFIENIEIAKKQDFKFNYSGDKDFLKYMNGNFDKINEISKYYSEINLFLKNIKWDTFFDKSIEKTALYILENISKNSLNKINLSIINMSSLEMIIIGKAYEDFGIKNIVYNFNRLPAINSASKTFEAFLFLLAYDSSPYFKQKVKNIVDYLKTGIFSGEVKNQYIIFDENNSIDNYNFHKIDDYLKNQIGFKYPKNVYRLDKFPDENFLSSKKIDRVLFFDNDNDYGKISNFYKDYFNEKKSNIKIIKIKYLLGIKYNDIGYYENYLIEKDKEYLVYKTNIEEKTKKTAINYKPDNNFLVSNDGNRTSNNTTYSSNKISIEDEQRKKIVPFLFSIPMLIAFFIVTDTGILFNGYSNGSSGTNINSGGFGGGNIGTSSSVSNSNTSSSIIKSFGGGGFSKGSSSS